MSTIPQFKSKRQQKIWERERQEVETKKKDSTSYVNQAPFRYCERNFKSRVPPPDYSNVIDFSNLPGNHNKESLKSIVPVKLKYDLSQLSPLFGDRQCKDGYILKDVPGLIVIPNAFTPPAQRNVIKQCLSLYTQPPNTSNLDTHYTMPFSGLWSLYEREECGELKKGDPEYFVPKKKAPEDSLEVPVKRELTACSDDFKPVIQEPKLEPSPASTVPLLPPSELVRKLRWVTLGYQYHWPTKTYHLDRRYPFPEDVAEFTKSVVHAIEGIGYDNGTEAWKNEYKGDDFIAEAGVINYYQYRDTLMGHVDRSELNMEAPLVSLSLGHSCIYLIGGSTREKVPTPLLLKSGDIIVMTGPCRKAFHGVPLIIENSLPEYLLDKKDPDYKLVSDFISTSRINLNIRQVYPPGEEK